METQAIDKNKLIALYMDSVLDKETEPKSIYKFAKDNNFEEADFYKFFSSFTSLKQAIFEVFFTNTHHLISSNEEYQSFDTKNKLLIFYYTFFEVLTANRSYVLFALKGTENKLESLKQLSLLRASFKNYIQSLDFKTFDFKKEEILKFQNKSIEEIAWTQLLLTIKFWIEDNSPSFEKTDLFIEKSIQAGFDIMDLSPLKNIIDFGKFLFKEKVKKH